MRSMARWARRHDSDEGSAAIEAAIVLPALIMFLCMAIMRRPDRHLRREDRLCG